jgi:hypothetical protein
MRVEADGPQARPYRFFCECLCHKSVQPGEEMHNVHQNKIEQGDITT